MEDLFSFWLFYSWIGWIIGVMLWLTWELREPILQILGATDE